MTKRNKLVFAICAVIIGIIAGMVFVFFNQEDLINEDEAKAIVTERYGGSVEAVEEGADDDIYIVNVEGDTGTHKITINRHDSSVEAIETIAKPSEDTAADDSNTSQEQNEGTENDEPSEPEKTEDESDTAPSKKEEPAESNEPEILTVEQAENAAANEVGGNNVYSTWSGEGQNREYYILQIVDGDDEGALVSLNGVTGQVNKVVYLDVRDDDYGNIEQLIYEANTYADMVDGRYIEFDDEYFDEEEDDDYEDDED